MSTKIANTDFDDVDICFIKEFLEVLILWISNQNIHFTIKIVLSFFSICVERIFFFIQNKDWKIRNRV